MVVAIKYKKINICHDFNLNLRMYDANNDDFKKFKILNKHRINLIDIDKVFKKKNLCNEIEIFWGNRLKIKQAQKLTKLKWVHFGSSGYDKDLFLYLNKKKIKVTNSKGILTNSVVSTIFAQIFSLSRALHLTHNLKYSKQLNRSHFDKFFYNITDVFDDYFLIVGLGDIGLKLANQLSVFSKNIYAIKSTIPKRKIQNIRKVYLINDIKKIINKFNFVINLLPHNNVTNNFFDQSVFNNMKKGSFFINAGRGDTVVLSDLVQAIKNGIIFSSAIDVYPKKDYLSPYKPTNLKSSIFKMPEVITTPHIAGLSNKYWKKQVDLFNKNLLNYKNKKKLINEIKN